MSEKILAIILARGGSKRIVNKNIKELNGKPLIAYTIEEAQKSKYLDRLILSTDDEEIIRVAKQFGAEIAFLRPKELATDTTTSEDAMVHAINWLSNNEGYNSDYVMLLQPTSPLRKAEDIDNAFEKLIKEKGDSIISLCKVDKHPYGMMKIENGKAIPYISNRKKYNRKQDLPNLYYINGAIYITKTNLFLKTKLLLAGKLIPYIMPKERSIDIDDIFDWRIAELFILNSK